MGVLKQKNVFIIGARRSGTHLITDLITNNFKLIRIDNSIDYDFLTDRNVDDFITTMKSGGKLAWSHFHDYKNFFDRELSDEHIQELRTIFQESKIIFIYRDIRDVITSDYHRKWHQENYDNFNDYFHDCDKRNYTEIVNNSGDTRNLIEILTDNHRNWFSVFFSRELLNLDFQIVSFEEIITQYDKTVERLSSFLEIQAPDEIKDVRLRSLDDEKPDIKYTHHDFRSGRIGDWENTFGWKRGEEVRKEYDIVISGSLKAYLSNHVLHENHVPERNNFQINSRNWELIEFEIDRQLMGYSKEFKDFVETHDIRKIIDGRYKYETNPDVRFYNKVFYFDDYVLKFMYPCKAFLDKKTFNHVIPVASKMNLLKTLKSHKILAEIGVMPRLYCAGIYNNIFFGIQEKLDKNKMLADHPLKNRETWWNWMIDTKTFPLVVDLYQRALKQNIVLKDLHSPCNLNLDNGVLKYVDLDGISVFNSRQNLLNSTEYQTTLKLMVENNQKWEKIHGENLIEISQNLRF